MASTVRTGMSPQKASIDDLAILGGAPAFQAALHVGRPNVGDRQKFQQRVGDILDRRWLTNGGYYVGEFERRVAELVGVEHCIAMCNATIGLEIAIRATEMTGEVIVPSFTFIATAHVLQWLGITPVFCDIDPETHNLDARKVEELITPRTTGILAVHVWGRPCDVDNLSAIAKRHGLTLLYDSAHAFGCSFNGQMIGRFGDAEVFSFHATKFLNSLEGGAVVTNDGELAAKIRLMKNFGFTNYDRTDYVGTNGKLNEVSAAMGLTNLESMDEFIAVNRRNYEEYRLKLEGIPGVSLIHYDDADQSNYQYIVAEIDDSATYLVRDQLVRILHAENVLARRYFYPGCHQMEPYRSLSPQSGLRLPETERLTERVLALPTGTAVGSREIEEISKIIGFTIAHGEEVAERLLTLGNDR
jgi:dTDP-4-amino-4,6-dideoxygalactose transaminase